MCGICGFVNLHGQPVDNAVGQLMMDLLLHRGPDAEGVLVKNSPTGIRQPSVFLGSRRLKIIDLSDAARQPLPNETSTIWVILNGEIYNFPELRHSLRQMGHSFRSHSDTETIVHAYETFGDDFVQRLDGMFAFALWDGQRGRLILARDRSGKKPLYYSADGRQVTFASEIKSLLVCPWVDRQVATEHISEYLALGYVATPRTLYRSICQVPPGSYMTVDGSGMKGPFKYWELKFPSHAEGNGSSVLGKARRVRQLLTDAVARRMISDVPLGAFLSGGLDSSIIVGIMSRLLKEPVRTFTIGFDDDLSYDERSYASLAAKRFGTNHTEFVVRGDAISLPLMELLLWHHDQPYGDSSAIPTYLVSNLARRYVTVAINGDGGDEVFAGYERFLAGVMAEKFPVVLTPIGRAVSRLLPNGHGYNSFRRRLERFFADPSASVVERFRGWTSIFDFPTLVNLLNPGLRDQLNVETLYLGISQCYKKTDGLPLLHKLLYLNFMTYLPGDLHVKMDRMSMANSLETRSPMLDTALVEFVAALPPDFKIRRGQLKYVLKLAFRDMLPRNLLTRKKHGFGAPVGHWFRHQLRSQAEEILLSSNARLRDYLNQSAIRRLFQEHIEGTMDHGHRLWVLLNFELWLRMLQAGTIWQPQRSSIVDHVSFAEVR